MAYDNLPAAYRELCKRHARRILFRNEHISYAQTWTQVVKRALFLQKQGIRKGDVVAILAPNSPEW